MTLQLKQFKQSVIKTEHSQEFQESLTRDYNALVNSVLWAHSPIYSLLSLVACWCSLHWYWSWTQYSTYALFHSLHTLHFHSDILPLLTSSRLTLCYVTTDSPRQDCTSCAVHWPYMLPVAFLKLSALFKSLLDIPFLKYAISLYEKVLACWQPWCKRLHGLAEY